MYENLQHFSFNEMTVRFFQLENEVLFVTFFTNGSDYNCQIFNGFNSTQYRYTAPEIVTRS